MEKISIELALERVLDGRRMMAVEDVPVYEILSRVLAEDITAQEDDPPFTRSAMDGYAVRSEDVKHASEKHPVTLHVEGRLCAGDAPSELKGIHTAIQIMTGAPIPDGADCVIRQEDTDYGDKNVQIYVPQKAGGYCTPAGKTFVRGEVLVHEGVKADAAAVAAAVNCGYSTVKVRKKLRVAILSSGSELCLPGECLLPGKIFDSNMAYLMARCHELGYEVVYSQIVDDQESVIADRMNKALIQADILITTGGVSVGKKDLFPELINKMDSAVTRFHGLDVKPGTYTMFSLIDDIPVLSLSGCPSSTVTMFEMLGVPLMAKMQGQINYLLIKHQAVMRQAFEAIRPLRRFVRGYYWDGHVLVANDKDTAHLRSGVGSNCLVDLPAGKEKISENTIVTIYRME